jgi:hypothetical protein
VLYRDDNDWMIWNKLDRKQIDAYTMIFSKTDWKTFENWLRCWENRVFSTFATRFCCGIPLRLSRRRIFWVDDLYHIQYWRILIKREFVRLLSMRRVNRCQISELYVYSLTLGTHPKIFYFSSLFEFVSFLAFFRQMLIQSIDYS